MASRNTFRIAVRKYEPFESAIAKAWAAFDAVEKTGLQLQAEALDLHPLSEILFDRDELKKGDVDIAFVNTDWVASLHERGSVLNLTPYIEANPPDSYPQGWMESLLRMQRFGDTTLGLPYHDGPECLIYRSDLFNDSSEQAAYKARFGADLRIPKNWDEFHQVARFFTRPERNLYGTVFAAFPDGHNTVYDFCLQLWTRGGELFDSANRMQLNSPQAIAALEFYRALLNDKAAMHPGAREMDSVKSGFAFAAGEVAMMINWFGFASMCETIPDSKVKGKVAIDVLPSAPNAASASLNVYWILTIGAGSPHADIAYRFLKFCASPEMDKLLTLEGAIGCRKSTWEDAEVNRVIPFYRTMGKLHESARELPRLSNWNDLASKIVALVMETINGDAPIGDLTARAQKALE